MSEDALLPLAARETLEIPDSVRKAVDERDRQTCRVCGRWLGQERALHHIVYGGTDRGSGGRRVHDVDQIVTVCWMWGGNCHDLVHSDKNRYQPLLLEVVKHGGLTLFQLQRWQLRNSRKQEL